MIAGSPPLGVEGTTVIIILAATVVLIAVLYPIARAIAKRMESRIPTTVAVPAGNPETDARLQRLEQSVEAMELELERISEGQRYTTKLLTERLPIAARIPQSGQSERTLL
jgi:hypothetical protein